MSQREWLLDIRGSNVVVLGIVNGLVSEIDIVKKALDLHRPRALGVCLSAEEIGAMREWSRDGTGAPDYTEADALYVREMSKYGEIRMPSPAVLYAITVSDETGIPVYPLDIDDNEYSELYLKHVSPVSLFLGSLFRKSGRRSHVGGTVEEAVCALDRLEMRPKSLAFVEKERERSIAANIRERSPDHSPFMALVTYERVKGVLESLNSSNR